jgi:hypothetical protein
MGLRGDALIALAAIVGASLVLGLVLMVSSRIPSPTTVLILGLMFGYAASAAVTVLVGASQPERLQQWAMWQFGSFSGVTRERLKLFAPLILFGIATAASTTKQLNALLLGEHYARSMGVAVRRARLLTMIGASVLGAVVTAFCGPVAFVGIAVPHICRGMLGSSDHRVLVRRGLDGGIARLAAQVVSLPEVGILPINAVTSLIGAPVVVLCAARAPGASADDLRGCGEHTGRRRVGACPANARSRGRLSRAPPLRAVLERVNLRAAPGELVCLLGPNGIGKSTLLRTPPRMQPPLWGSVELGGSDMLSMTQGIWRGVSASC